jgi:hypothetical protein
MASCLEVVSRALRLARIVGLGEEPSDTELDDGMFVLQSIYQRIADTALAASDEIYIADDYTAGENERIYSTGTVTLPDLIDDGSDRRVKDLASVQYNEGDGWQTWISDRGDWVRVDDLESSDEAPLSSRNKEGLACLVAVEYAGTFGALEIDAATVQKARRFQSQLQPRDDTPNVYY